jgi:acetyltransferase
LGRLLLAHLIEYARNRGISELFGDVLAENRPMLALCSQLGFITSATESSDVLRATLAPQLAPA